MDMSKMEHSMMAHVMKNNTNTSSLGHGIDKMPMMMMMQMTFYASNKVTLWFDGWKTTSVGEMIGTCIAIILLGIAYEGLKVGRQILLVKSNKRSTSSNVYVNPLISGQTTYGTNNDIPAEAPCERMFSCSHLLQTFLHMLQVFLGYLLMLAFMTYNAWVCIAVIIGAGIGYFIFGWNSPGLAATEEHCN